MGGFLLLSGGMSVLLNAYVTIGLWLLVGFLVPVTFLMHAFWRVEEPMAKVGEMVNFTKNVGLLGGVLILLSRGL